MQTVENWQDIINNLREFKKIENLEISEPLKRFSNFYHWYYFPEEDSFAPGKFIGYKGTKTSNYVGDGDGGETQNVLSTYFDKLPGDSELFHMLFHKLQIFATSLGKNINSKTSAGNGGIYVPKHQSIYINYSQQLLATSTADINAYKVEETVSLIEGEKILKLVNIYERNPVLRAKAIKIHGTICKVCNFDFELEYGEHGKDYIEVHHLKPLHKLPEPSHINPETDLTVLCANCHRMIHRKVDNILSIEELRNIKEKARKTFNEQKR